MLTKFFLNFAQFFITYDTSKNFKYVIKRGGCLDQQATIISKEIKVGIVIIAEQCHHEKP